MVEQLPLETHNQVQAHEKACNSSEASAMWHHITFDGIPLCKTSVGGQCSYMTKWKAEARVIRLRSEFPDKSIQLEEGICPEYENWCKKCEEEEK